MTTTPQPLHKPTDQGAARNPNRRTLSELSRECFNTEQAAVYLQEKHRLDISAITLTNRRSYGKAPAYVKDADFIRYNKNDLDMFARQVGLSSKAYDQPVHARMSATERAQRAAAASKK